MRRVIQRDLSLSEAERGEVWKAAALVKIKTNTIPVVINRGRFGDIC